MTLTKKVRQRHGWNLYFGIFIPDTFSIIDENGVHPSPV